MFYLVCSTPRVGSNLLDSFLRETGLAGNPTEYFNAEHIIPRHLERCGFSSVDEAGRDLNRYFDTVREQLSAGGRFGLKAHFSQLRWAVEHGFDLQSRFPDKVIYCTRGDVVAQAISFVRANQTNAWVYGNEETRAPRFDPDAITHAISNITDQNHCWETFFRQQGIQPYRVPYERLCVDKEAELVAVLDYLDIDMSSLDLTDVLERAQLHYRPQRDQVNADWHREYARFIKARSLTTPC